MCHLPWNEWPLPLVRIVQNFFTAGFDSSQPRQCQNIFQLDLYQHHNSLAYSYFISFGKMVCDVFCTGPDLWLANFKNWLKILSGWPWFVCSHCKWTSSEKRYREKLMGCVPFEWSCSGSVIQDHSDHSTLICPRQRFISSFMCHDLSELGSLILT